MPHIASPLKNKIPLGVSSTSAPLVAVGGVDSNGMPYLFVKRELHTVVLQKITRGTFVEYTTENIGAFPERTS
ncbi:MAG: hypothetical protein N2Z76_05365 [Treponemataceae bacterium]|nr:hypothetical protein [Treponemataceae bacterium]